MPVSPLKPEEKFFLKKIGSFLDPLQIPTLKEEIAFAGKSNAGKSSLLKALAKNPSLIRTSQKPGTTRSIDVYEVEERFYLIDTPGIGYAKLSKKQRKFFEKLIQNYLITRKNLRYFLFLQDAKRYEIEKEVFSLLSFLPRKKKVLVWTKIDRLSQKERSFLKKKEELYKKEFSLIFYTSVFSYEGLGELRDFLVSF